MCIRDRKYAVRTIIFCKRKRHCRELYETFITALGDDAYDFTVETKDDRSRFVAMFQQGTDSQVKETIISSFADHDGTIRVLFATIAFGMGMDVKGLENIIHLGPPNDLDDYLQETGRAGRDTSVQSYAILVKYSQSVTRVSKAMNEYVNGNECRRKKLMSYFDCKPSDMVKHLCCDICSAKCTCECNCDGACSCVQQCTYAGNTLELKIQKEIAQAD
ncbi:ATP-dependent DNA helicase RecQ-like [Anneissia japonica]|uniref:ATP-dependent DNA helicase RecQ-like n=1 Tax=Anneissia japonica TaxID=1529436 RepID=UPI001425ABD7|nr:ATP-dependent DNA helicase RecQ-like [Anneissia japonica]